MQAVYADISSFAYSAERTVLRRVRLDVATGDSVAVLGASGCGKSTLLRLVSGILPGDEEHALNGSVRVFGKPPEEYRKGGQLAFMFQEAALFPNRTVRENVTLPLELRGQSDPALVDQLLGIVGLEEFADYLPRRLSGGMRTRVALARSFVTRPRLLLMDEPFAALDIIWKRELYTSLSKLKEQFQATAVMVTHDLQEAVYNANRILVLGRRGSPIDLVEIDRPLPRPFDFSDTVSELTSHIDYLAHLITSDASGKTVAKQSGHVEFREREQAEPVLSSKSRGNGASPSVGHQVARLDR